MLAMEKEKQTQFLKDLEARLEENRKIAQKSYVPAWLQPLASYLGFHAFRALFLLSLAITIFMFWWQFDLSILTGKKIFFYR